MGVFKDLLLQSLQHRTVVVKLTRSDYYKLQMICEAVNEHVALDEELTPDLIATRVLETFILQSFEDSTSRIVKGIVPEVRKRRSRS